MGSNIVWFHELRSDDLARFLKDRPALLEKLARIVGQRLAVNVTQLASAASPNHAFAIETATLLQKVCAFLKL